MNLKLEAHARHLPGGLHGLRARPPSAGCWPTAWAGSSSIRTTRSRPAEKTAIAEIFEPRGEREFRRIETEAIRPHVRWIERGRPAVLALGGGAFAQPANRDLLADNGVTRLAGLPVRDRPAARGRRRTHRPLARDPQKFAALYEARRAAYGLADVRVAIESDDPAVPWTPSSRTPAIPMSDTEPCADRRSPSSAPRWRRPTRRTPSYAQPAQRARATTATASIYVVGAGKAGASMARAAERVLGRRITAGLINVKYGHLAKLRRIELNECGHPVPDERGRGGRGAHRRNRRGRPAATTW